MTWLDEVGKGIMKSEEVFSHYYPVTLIGLAYASEDACLGCLFERSHFGNIHSWRWDKSLSFKFQRWRVPGYFVPDALSARLRGLARVCTDRGPCFQKPGVHRWDYYGRMKSLELGIASYTHRTVSSASKSGRFRGPNFFLPGSVRLAHIF